MAYLLQPECNFLHGVFRCKLPVEVVDVEMKIMSMQGTHIFRSDWTTQLIKCTPWSTTLHPHPTIIKKMKTFLEVEGKVGPVPASPFRPPLPDTSPNIRKDNAAEKRKRATPKRFRLATPKPTTTCPPLPEAPPKPKNEAPDSQPLPSVPVHKSTPWPGTGKMSGNLFEDRNWLLPPNYLDNGNENKTENAPKIVASVTSPRPPIKKEEKEPKTNDKSTEKMQLGTRLPFLQISGGEKGTKQGATTEDVTQIKVTRATGQKTKDPELEHDKSQAAMGSRNREIKFKIQPQLSLRFRVGLRIR